MYISVDSFLHTSSSFSAGMEWALGDSPGKVAVASMSLGGGPSLATDNAVAALAAGNVFITVAAGNDDGDACLGSPARATDVSNQCSGRGLDGPRLSLLLHSHHIHKSTTYTTRPI